jgi:glycosyltransferase involved in cell wall biosynthesis
LSAIVPADYAGPPPDAPLVSCLLVTGSARALIGRAIGQFLRQDYPNRELVVVEDGAEPIGDLAAADPRITLLRLAGAGVSIARRRNAAAELASGELLVCWDDDAWHPPWRLSYQVGGMLQGGYELTGQPSVLAYDPRTGRSWVWEGDEAAERTLCMTRECWRRRPFGVAAGWARALADGYVSSDAHLHVALLAARTRPPNGTCRRLRRLPAGLERELTRYLADDPLPPARDAAGLLPLVSCIMPTCDRRAFVARAIGYFERQDYARRELVIVDDGSEPVADLITPDAPIRHVRLNQRRSIGIKRNLACEHARGEIILQFDDDDWHGPDRLSRQIAPIASGRAELTGLYDTPFFDLTAAQFWALKDELWRRMFVEGMHSGTLAFRRDVWLGCGGYPNGSLAEDAVFLRRALAHGARMVRLPALDSFVYVRHSLNSWSFDCGSYHGEDGWRRIPAPEFVCADDIASFETMRPASAAAARAPIGTA